MAELPQDEKSLWRESYSGPLYPALNESLETDVVIIGAGITGLTSAYLLKQAGLKVVVLDKDTVGGGTTGRTTGKVTSQHGLIYETLLKSIGQENTRLYGEANQAAVENIGRIIAKEKIDCDWQQLDNFVYTADKQKIAQFKKEAEVAVSLGLPASFETSLDLPFDIAGAVKFSDQGRINAQKYLLGLAEAVEGDGSHVFEHSTATGIRDGTPCRVKTSRGEVIAKDIIVATNVPTMPLMARGGYCALEYPTESYIIAGPYDSKLKGMYISPDSQQYSLLSVEFDGQPYLLIGGGGHMSGLRGSKRWRFERLARYANDKFGMKTLTHKWSDRDYMAYDKIPLIGKLYPWSKHLYVGTAFKKWGLSGGTVAAMILSDLITGKENKWAPVFTPQRLRPITSIPRAVIEQVGQLGRP